MGIKNWVQQGTAVYFGNGGIDLKGQPDAENKARLIASAPALLDTLEEIIDIYGHELHEKHFKKAEAAIAAARGDL